VPTHGRSRSPRHAAMAVALLTAPALLGLLPAGVAWSVEDTPPLGLPALQRVTVAAGLGGFHHAGWLGDTSPVAPRPEFPETMGPGACWVDVDGDDWLDLYLVNGLYLSEPDLNAARHPRSMLYRNAHDGTFTDVTDAAGVGLEVMGQGCAAADYDNDGATDLYVTGWAGATLFRNLGDGTFANVTDEAGVGDRACGEDACWGTTATWLDFDRDGCLDLFAGHYTPWDPGHVLPQNSPGPGQPNRLFRNLCDGAFADATAAAGLVEVKDTWASVAADLDDDGWPDLYVANDQDPNDLYINHRDGTFRNRAGSVANNSGRAAMGAAAGDFNGDGRLDLAVTNFVQQTNGVFRAVGADYVDVGMEAPLDDAMPLSGWAPRWFDVDNDGLTDLMTVNGLPNGVGADPRHPLRVYRNVGTGFAQVAPMLGPDFQALVAGRGAAWGDYDNDGDVDVLVAEGGEADTHLFRSVGSGGNFLALGLRGTVAGVNRDAIGARVTVRAAGLPDQMQEKTAGDGLMSTSDPRLHFGLGMAASADVMVRWPDGTTASYPGLRANSFLRLVQGDALPHILRALPLVALAGPSAAAYGTPAAFTAQAELAAGASLAQVDWDFGDGSSLVGGPAEAQHAFQDIGAMVVRATVTDTLGRAKTAALRVAVADTLQQNLAMDHGTFTPLEPAAGRVTVRFSDDRPVAGAEVHVHVTYASGSPDLDAFMATMPLFVREAMGYVDHDLAGLTGSDGVAAFTVPYSIPPPSDFVPLQANHPGVYTATATGTARGSTFAPVSQVYRVGVPVE
jgi:enediyne biosynthesis protein E4